MGAYRDSSEICRDYLGIIQGSDSRFPCQSSSSQLLLMTYKVALFLCKNDPFMILLGSLFSIFRLFQDLDLNS